MLEIKNTKFLLFGIVALLIIFISSAHSNAEGNWLDAGEPTLKDYGSASTDSALYRSLILYNECFNTKFIIADSSGSNTKEVCAYKVPGGLIGSGKYFKRDGTKVAGTVKTNTSTGSFISALPNGIILELTPHKNGNNLEIHKKLGGFNNINSYGNYGSAGFTYTLDTSDFLPLKGPEGDLVVITPRGISYSKSGRYMVADSPSHGFIKIDLMNGDIVKFADSLRPWPWDTTLQSAISDDGSYVATASYSSGYIRVFNLKECNEIRCMYTDLHPFLSKKIIGFVVGAKNLRFNGNSIFFDAANRYDNKVTYSTYAMAPAGDNINESQIDYLALGDSFASGEGAFNYLSATDTINNKCHVSVNSYPFLIAESTDDIDTYKSVACSGAKIRDVTTLDSALYSEDPQARGKEASGYDDEIFSNYLPGYRAQLLHETKSKPKVLTISTVGNDIGFGEIIKKCVLSATTCYEENSYGRFALASTINNKYDELVAMFNSVKNNLPIGGRAYVIGYPQVLDPYGDCAANVLMNRSEGIFTQKLIALLNSRVEMAAKQAGIYFVSTEDAFNGYRLCETASNLAAMNGLGNNVYWADIEVFGRVVRGPKFESESYHPNRLGHELFAKTIKEQTNNFTSPMPEAEISDPWIKDQLWLDFVGDTNWPEKAMIHYDDSVSADVIFKNAGLEYNINGQEFSLKPNAEYELSYYSDEVFAGTATSDSSGNLSGSMPIPDELPPGYHTLSIKGVNIVDEDVDIQKIVYVAASPEDIDGDGTPNTEEICLLVEPAGIDTDQDGVDDACDGFIDEPPAPADDPVNVGEVDNPDITNTNKDLPVSESRPQWLLDLEAEIQARNALIAQQEQQAAAEQPANTNNSPGATTNTNSAQTTGQQTQSNEQTTPQTSSATAVRGIEQTSQPAKPADSSYKQANPFSWIIALPITFALLIISYLIYRRYATQEQ